jgi:hypothetical protein
LVAYLNHVSKSGYFKKYIWKIFFTFDDLKKKSLKFATKRNFKKNSQERGISNQVKG